MDSLIVFINDVLDVIVYVLILGEQMLLYFLFLFDSIFLEVEEEEQLQVRFPVLVHDFLLRLIVPNEFVTLQVTQITITLPKLLIMFLKYLKLKPNCFKFSIELNLNQH